MWYHALNRGNRREAVFHKPGDSDAFVEAMIDAGARLPIDLLGYCLMLNHFHLLLRTHHDGVTSVALCSGCYVTTGIMAPRFLCRTTTAIWSRYGMSNGMR